MRAADTSVLVRLLARDDAKQTRRAEEFVAGGAWVSLLALAETCWVLDSVYGRDAKQIASAIDMLLEHQQIVLQDPQVVAAANRIFRAKPALGISDCLLLEIARKEGHVPLGTFDAKLGKQDGAETLSH